MEEESLAMQAKRLIEEEYPYLDGVEDLADRIAVSKCHLIRLFTREFGISPGQYLIKVRINAARQYLLEREHSVEMIAGLVGFSNGNYFARCSAASMEFHRESSGVRIRPNQQRQYSRRR